MEHQNRVCPNCGYCPACGRRNTSPYVSPFYPYTTGPIWYWNPNTQPLCTGTTVNVPVGQTVTFS